MTEDAIYSMGTFCVIYEHQRQGGQSPYDVSTFDAADRTWWRYWDADANYPSAPALRVFIKTGFTEPKQFTQTSDYI